MPSDVLSEFIVAACVPIDASHSSGRLDEANAILAAHPELATLNIHTAAILGDDVSAQRFLTSNPSDARSKGGPHGWDALTHLCFSRYLRLDRTRSLGFLRAARILLDAGASANTGFFSNDHQPKPEFECVLYGAAGVAHDPDLTKLLLERGADPNDGEVSYHAPEGDNEVLKVLVRHGGLTRDSMATMLLRKADWHDLEGIKFLLKHGADPNAITCWGKSALHQAVQRDNALENIKALLDHGGDPKLPMSGPASVNHNLPITSTSLAARRGRGDVLELLENRGLSIELNGVEALIAFCARNQREQALNLAGKHPQLVNDLKQSAGRLLAEFAGNENTEGVRLLLDLGLDIDARYEQGDGYFGIAPNSTALHVAAWRAAHSTVSLLLARGAEVDACDGKGQTPLALAVRACIESWWTERRAPQSVAALLKYGAAMKGVRFPSGYAEVDRLLSKHRK